MMQILMARGLHEALTIGVSDAVHIGHWLAALVQDLHLLAHRHKASPVCLSIYGGQVQSLQIDRQVVNSVALFEIALWTGIMQLEWIFSTWDISTTKEAPRGGLSMVPCHTTHYLCQAVDGTKGEHSGLLCAIAVLVRLMMRQHLCVGGTASSH